MADIKVRRICLVIIYRKSWLNFSQNLTIASLLHDISLLFLNIMLLFSNITFNLFCYQIKEVVQANKDETILLNNEDNNFLPHWIKQVK